MAMDAQSDLPSWIDGPAKSAVLEFLQSVTTPGVSFVPPPDRIATFDNDGTLWCEKPLYVQADFIFRRFTAMVRENPSGRRSSRTRPSSRVTASGWRTSMRTSPRCSRA